MTLNLFLLTSPVEQYEMMIMLQCPRVYFTLFGTACTRKLSYEEFSSFLDCILIS